MIVTCMKGESPVLLWELRLAKTMNNVFYRSRIRNKRFLISDSRDMEDRVNWCVIWSLLFVMYKHLPASGFGWKNLDEFIYSMNSSNPFVNEFI